ncbi:MAG: hypothetical protein ACM3VS_18270, partial [Candidatus Dadabacteria bacterium]
MSNSTPAGIAKNNPKVLFPIVSILTSLLLLTTGVLGQKIQFDQARNGQSPTFQIEWSNGILNKTHSTYYEGMSTPQRLFISGISGGTHTLIIKHLAVKQGSHGYDFLDSWPQAVQAATGNELGNLYAAQLDDAPSEFTEAMFGNARFTSSNPNYAKLVYSTLNFGSPQGYSGVDAALSCFTGSYGAPYLELVGNAAIQNATITALPGYDADYKVYSITWTSASTMVFLRFAGHLAVGTGACGYGEGMGAGSINGGPYHIKLIELDDHSTGERDNQVMTGVVMTRPFCAITPSAQTICQGNTATFSGPAGLASYVWSITPTTGVTLSSTTGRTVTVTALAAGTYTLTLSTSIHLNNSNSIHLNKVCEATLIVLPAATVNAGTYTVCVGSTVQLVGSPSGGTWSGTHVTGTTFSAVGLTPGTYTATYTYGSGTCINSSTATITVTGLPTVSATASPTTVVSFGQTSTLSALGSVGGVQNNSLFSSFTWSAVLQPGFSNGIAGLSSTSGASVIFTPPNVANANYKFMVTATTIGGCTATATVTVATGSGFGCTVTANANNASVCSGSTVTLTGTPASGTWSGTYIIPGT